MKSVAYVLSMYLILILLSIILSTVSWSVVSNLRHADFLDAVERYETAAAAATRDPSQRFELDQAANALRSFSRTPEIFERFIDSLWISAMIYSLMVASTVGMMAGFLKRWEFVPIALVLAWSIGLYYLVSGPLAPVYQNVSDSWLLFGSLFIFQALVGSASACLGRRYRKSVEAETAPKTIRPRSESAFDKERAEDAAREAASADAAVDSSESPESVRPVEE